LHVLIPSNLHLNVLLIQRTVEVLGEDIHTVLLGSNPLDSNQAVFFQISQVELATWAHPCTDADANAFTGARLATRHHLLRGGICRFGGRGSGFGVQGSGVGEGGTAPGRAACACYHCHWSVR
jgi:hypothetical protein